jgi:hypothetical protein
LDGEPLTIGLKFGDFTSFTIGDQLKRFLEMLFCGIRNLNLSDMLSTLGVNAMEAFNPEKLFKDKFGETEKFICRLTTISVVQFFSDSLRSNLDIAES